MRRIVVGAAGMYSRPGTFPTGVFDGPLNTSVCF